MIKAIIFDFGGVLSPRSGAKDFKKYADKNGFNGDEIKEFYLEHMRKARIGNMDSYLFWEVLGKKMNMDADKLLADVTEYFGFRDELLGYIKELKKNYKVGMLSNHIKSWIDKSEELFHFYDYFDAKVVSDEAGVAKPDPKIYELIVKKLNVDFSECVFIDDLERNLVTAQGLGMKTIQFKSFEQFKEELEKIITL